MKYYLFKDYITGGNALFDTRKTAEDFQDKFINFMELNDLDFSDCEYEIEELELNPDFNKWMA